MAAADSIVPCWPSATWPRLTAKSPVLAVNALKTVDRPLQDTQTRALEASSEQDEQRIAHVLQRLAKQARPMRGSCVPSAACSARGRNRSWPKAVASGSFCASFISCSGLPTASRGPFPQTSTSHLRSLARPFQIYFFRSNPLFPAGLLDRLGGRDRAADAGLRAWRRRLLR